MSALVFKRHKRQLVQRIVLYVFLAASWAFLAGSEYWSIREARQTALQNAQVHSLNLATSLAQHTSDTLAIADAIVSGLLDRIDQTPQTPENHDAMHNFLMREALRSNRIHGLFIFDAEGRWINSSLNRTPSNHNNSDRAYFIYHRSHPDNSALVGAPIQSRSDGTWVITLSRRRNTSSGKFAGVVLATIQLRYFREYYSKFNVGVHGTIGMVNNDGTVLVRWPDGDEVVGSSIVGSAVYDAIRTLQRGTAIYQSPIDGVKRISSFAPALPYPLTIAAGVSVDETLVVPRQAAMHRVAIAGLGVLMLLAVAIWLDLQLRRMHHREWQLSSEVWQDPLTGIANRRAFDHRLAEALAQAQRTQTALSVLLIDVDYFKLYNDTYGHVNGDVCLRRIADTIASCATRAGDVPARYGGEEFAIILPRTHMYSAWHMAEDIRAAVHAAHLPHASSPTSDRVTVSIGVASIEPHQEAGLPSGGLVDRADAALYRAKQSGRDKVSA